jgi:hypothetical protein
MGPGFRLKSLCIVVACVAIQIPIKSSAQSTNTTELTASQTVSVADLTPKELAYYKTITDPEVARSFIITRSYVRLCQSVMERKMPAEQLPDKPLGFSARFVLPSEVTMINDAIADSIVAACHADPKACLGGN